MEMKSVFDPLFFSYDELWQKWDAMAVTIGDLMTGILI